MKYGRIDIKIPTFEKEYDAIDENLKKEEITESEAKKLRKDLDVTKIAYLLGTNKLPLRSAPRYGSNLKNMGTGLKRMNFRPMIVD